MSKITSKLEEKEIFFSAGDRDTAIVDGEKGNIETSQVYLKDPIFVMEELVTILTENRYPLVRQELLEVCGEILGNGNCIEYGVSPAEIIRFRDWIGRLEIQPIEKASFGRVRIGESEAEAPIGEYMRGLGGDTKVREQVLGSARASALIMRQLLKTAGKQHYWWWKKLLQAYAGYTAKRRVAENFVKRVQIAVAIDANEIKGIVHAVKPQPWASLNVKPEWDLDLTEVLLENGGNVKSSAREFVDEIDFVMSWANELGRLIEQLPPELVKINQFVGLSDKLRRIRKPSSLNANPYAKLQSRISVVESDSDLDIRRVRSPDPDSETNLRKFIDR